MCQRKPTEIRAFANRNIYTVDLEVDPGGAYSEHGESKKNGTK